eukprot:7415486-Pyramimonas_sp.AAC.1
MEVMEKGGFVTVKVAFQVYFHMERELMVIVHGGGYLSGGRMASLGWLDDLIKGHFKVKMMPRVGNPRQ